MRYRMGVPAFAVGLAAVSIGFGAPAAQAAAANATLTTFAGYGLPTAPATATASMSFKVPTVSGCTSAKSGVAIGGGVTAGTGATLSVTGAAVVVGCTGGKAGYGGVLEIKNKVTTLTVVVSPGDSIVITASLSATKSTVSFADSTKHFSKTLSGTGAKPAQVADGMTAVPVTTGSKVLAPIPNFGKVSIAGAKLDGTTPKAAGAIAVDMKSSKGILQISTGILNATGNGWTETFKHA